MTVNNESKVNFVRASHNGQWIMLESEGNYYFAHSEEKDTALVKTPAGNAVRTSYKDLADRILKHIIDRFGEKVFTAPRDENHFIVETTVSLSQTFYGWVFSFGGKMTITSPQEAKDGFTRILDKFKK